MANEQKIGALLVEVSANIAKYQTAMQQTQRETQQMVSGVRGKLGAMEGHFKTAATGIKTAMAGMAASLTVGAFTSFVKSAIDTADGLAKMSQKVGVAVEDLSKLQYAGSLADVSADQLGVGLKQLSKNLLAAASGTKEQVAAFQALGVATQNADGSMRKSVDVFNDIADRFAGMEDGAVKTAIAMKIFGKSGADMIVLLNAGSDGLRRAGDEAARLGIVLDEKTAKAAEEFNDNLTRLSKAGSGLGLSIARDLLPPLVQMTESMNNLVQSEGWNKFWSQTGKGLYNLMPLASSSHYISQWVLSGKPPGWPDESQEGKRFPMPARPVAKKPASDALKKYLDSLETSTKRRTATTKKKIKELPSAYEMMTKDLKSLSSEMAKWWEEDQRKMREDAEWISDQRNTFTSAISAMMAAEKEMSVVTIGHNIALTDQAEAFRELTRSEAAGERLKQYQDLLDVQQKWFDLTGQGAEEVFASFMSVKAAQYEVLRSSDNALAGIQDGLASYSDSMPSMFEDVSKLVADSFKGMEDALVDFVRTGKLEFSDLVDSIIADIARMTIRQNITGPLSGLLSSGIGSLFGGGVNVDTWGGLEGGLLGGYAKGTNYVPQTGPYLLHKGEAVIPADKNNGMTINVPVNVAGNNAMVSELRNEIEDTVISVVRRHS